MAEEKQDGQKTLVAFVVGLLIGGMLVWAFSGPNVNAPDSEVKVEKAGDESNLDNKLPATNDGEVSEDVKSKEITTLEVGDGKISVSDQKASNSIILESAIYPVSEGWIGVREYDNEKLGFILGVVRFSKLHGLIPSTITLQRSTIPGRQYAVVIFTEDGDYDFSLAGDVQIDKIFDTFTAQ